MKTTVSCPLPVLLLSAATALTASMCRVDKALRERKTVLQVIMERYLEVNCVDNKPDMNTDLIETMKLENLTGQAEQGLYSGEARHESRGARRSRRFP